MDGTLKVPSITGVDLELEIAGPGGRSYAFVVDWHIRLVLSVAWFVTGSFLFTGAIQILEQGDAAFTVYMFTVLLPASALYFLYHPVLEIIMKGRTPGKRMAGVRIVTRDGTTPSVGALLIRNVFRLLDSLPFFYATGLIATLLTRQSVRVGDLAAGTLLVYDSTRKSGGLLSGIGDRAVGKIGLAQAELVRELLDRWDQLDTDARIALARQVLSKHDEPVPEVTTETDLHMRLQALLT